MEDPKIIEFHTELDRCYQVCDKDYEAAVKMAENNIKARKFGGTVSYEYKEPE